MIASIKDPLILIHDIHKDMLLLAQESSSSNSSSDAIPIPRLLPARLSRLRCLLYDERRINQSQTVAHDTMTGLLQTNVIRLLLTHLIPLPFESRKDVAATFNYLLVCGIEGADAPLYHDTMLSFATFIQQHFQDIMTPIIQGHACTNTNTPDIVLHCGSMYRACLKSPILYQQLVQSTSRVEAFVFPLLDIHCHEPNFDLASDAMETIRLVLTDDNSSEFLQRDYEALFNDRLNPLLAQQGHNMYYIVKRMVLQIIMTVLLTRANYVIMIQYIQSKANLILIMLLLRDTSPHITWDAFHVFKIFVANPNKPKDIIKILTDNKVKLVKYLEGLHKEKECADAQFLEEKALVISTLEEL